MQMPRGLVKPVTKLVSVPEVLRATIVPPVTLETSHRLFALSQTTERGALYDWAITLQVSSEKNNIAVNFKEKRVVNFFIKIFF
jgi:hypothetical protein